MADNKHTQGSKEYILDDVLKYEQPTKYIVKSTNYDDSYDTPVLTAGKSFVIGYTNEAEGICKDLPVIIFDDFTTSSQYVDFPFKVKSSAMKILHPTEDANIKYLYYFMQTIQHKADTHKRYWISEYSQREINLPSKPEQDKIVEKIEEEFGKIDEGVEKLKLAQEQIKLYRQSVLKSAFDGKLYKTTEWGNVAIKDVADVGTGATPLKSNSKYYGGNIAWVTSGELNNNFVTTASDYITDLAVKETNVTVYPIHTLLIAMYGEGKTRGKCSELLIEAGTNQAIAAIQITNEKVNREYLKKYCLYNYNNIRLQSMGGVQPNLNLTKIKNILFPLPTLDEQKQIVKEIEKRFEVADEVERVITENLEKAEPLKQSILKKAFVGKLVPQDPTDEPVSVLLDRIKAERNK